MTPPPCYTLAVVIRPRSATNSTPSSLHEESSQTRDAETSDASSADSHSDAQSNESVSAPSNESVSAPSDGSDSVPSERALHVIGAEDEEGDIATSPSSDSACGLEGSGSDTPVVPSVATGEYVDADVDLHFENGVTLERAAAMLRYRVTGSGSPETHIVGLRTLCTGAVGEGHHIRESLRFDVPSRGPLSYAGSYIQIEWSVVVEVIDEHGQIAQQHAVLRVLPRPVESAS